MSQDIEFQYRKNGIMSMIIDGVSVSIDVRKDPPSVKYEKIRQLILDAGLVFSEKIEKDLKKALRMK